MQSDGNTGTNRDSSENPGEDSSNKPASVEAPVTKEDGSVFKMFVISEATMINKGR